MTNNLLDELNQAQQRAVLQLDGPMMVIAGAGSGKTRVLTYKIAYMLTQNVDAFKIMALTFTNKAATEMKERVSDLVGNSARDVWMGTFHSIFARLLRTDGHLLGYPHNYTIYDRDDSNNLIKKIVKDFALDPKTYPHNVVLNRISAAKSELISAKDYAASPAIIELDKSARKPEIYRIYREYQSRLFRAAAMDFDDIIFNFYLLITNFPEILDKYQRKFEYFLIDEFQDTNKAQYNIIKMLVRPNNNLCVVGDDAQSIYAFRGANIENILGFKTDYPDYKLFKLEQNYRSTSHIVAASNSVIAKNLHQIKKNIWTSNNEGELVDLIHAVSDSEEASKVASAIFEKKMNQHCHNRDFAILYRTNAQSRTFEEALRKINIPYTIYGGLSFYQRKEIMDLRAYFRVVINHSDEEALSRIINFPPRGIGMTTIGKIQNFAMSANITTWEAMSKQENLNEMGLSSNTAKKIDEFVTMIENFSLKLHKENAFKLAQDIIHKTGIIRTYKEDITPEGVARIQNIEELINAIRDYSETNVAIAASENAGVVDENAIVTLDMYMNDTALATDADRKSTDGDDKVQLMTIHAAKGLEFDNVFVVGLEENLFPSTQSIYSREDLEEERRLLYVACTRAKNTLTLTYASNRYRWGELASTEPSRFLNDFDKQYLNIKGNYGSKYNRNKPLLYGFSNTYHDQTPNRQHGDKIQTNTKNNGQPASYYTTSNDIASKYELQQVDNYDTLKVGNRVFHPKFYCGTIVKLDGFGPNRKAEVTFDGIGKKMLLLRFAKLQLILKE